MEQDLRDILDEFGSRFYVDSQGKHYFNITDRNKFALEILKLCNLYIVKKRAYNKWFERVKYVGFFAAGFFVAAILFSMFS